MASILVNEKKTSWKHLYSVKLFDDYVTSKWVHVWARNKEHVYEVCAEKYPDRLVEEIKYIK